MYKRIIDLPRPVSQRPKMSALDRAAQFSAFAALVGLDEQMDETARRVEQRSSYTVRTELVAVRTAICRGQLSYHGEEFKKMYDKAMKGEDPDETN